MARMNMGNVTMRARESGTGGLIRFEVTDPNGVVYNVSGHITNMEINMERPTDCEFGRPTFATGPAVTTMTFTVQCTTALTRDTYEERGNVTPAMGAALRGPTPADAWMDEAIPYTPTRPVDDTRAREILAAHGVSQAVMNPRPIPHITHTFEVNEAEPGICARASCGMWPEHHDHDQTRWNSQCVCSECMPDADDLPDDQVAVSMRSETTMRPGPITGASHP